MKPAYLSKSSSFNNQLSIRGLIGGSPEMPLKAAPRKPSGRKQICGYSIGVSTAFVSTLLCMFLMCFFFFDMEMIYRKAGLLRATPPPLLLQTPEFDLSHSASQSQLVNSTNPVATPAVEIVPSNALDSDPVGNQAEEDASPAQVVDEEVGNLAEEDASPAQVVEEVGGVEKLAEEDTAPAQVDPKPVEQAVVAPDAEVLEMPRAKRALVGCDITQGQWVYDNASYPLYHTRNCPFADPGFRCEENGRPDTAWMSYHWQPHDCDLPRFNATDILERLRGQRLVFVGDSLGRNNWESMLCMLAEGVPNKSRIYEVNGEPITKHSGKLVYRFEDFNCTVEYYRDPFLVPQTRPPRGAPANVTCVLRVDHVSWSVDKWWDADIIIFNAGHWWTEHKIFRQGCRFQEGGRLKWEYDVPAGLGKALHTWAAWLEEHLDRKKTQAFWLSFPTVHFRGGSWNHGGHCHQEHRPLTEEEVRAEWQTPWMNKIVQDEFMSRIKKKLSDTVTYLDITTATNYRSDGHGALYTWDTKKFGLKPKNRQDCSHFCLPGVPDAWNELILASLFAKGKRTWAQSVRS